MIIEKKDDIYKLMDKFEKSSLTELELEIGEEFKIKLSKKSGGNIPFAPVPAQSYSANVSHETFSVSQTQTAVNPAVPPESDCIKAPLVGTFYSSPAPEAEAFVSAGSEVKKGTVICIVEAMKVMNEVESEFDCEIIEVLAENGQMVEYGQPLFRIKKK